MCLVMLSQCDEHKTFDDVDDDSDNDVKNDPVLVGSFDDDGDYVLMICYWCEEH